MAKHKTMSDLVEKVMEAVTEVGEVSVRRAPDGYYEVIEDDTQVVVDRLSNRDSAAQLRWQWEQESHALAAALAVLDAIADPSEALLTSVAVACSKRPAQDDDSDTTFIYRAIIAALREELVS